MTTDRSYRRALPVSDAIAELERCAGTQFDPDVVARARRASRWPTPRASRTGSSRSSEPAPAPERPPAPARAPAAPGA